MPSDWVERLQIPIGSHSDAPNVIANMVVPRAAGFCAVLVILRSVMMFDLERFKRWDRQVDHGNDELVEGAIAEIERLRDALTICANHADDMPLVVKTAVEALN